MRYIAMKSGSQLSLRGVLLIAVGLLISATAFATDSYDTIHLLKISSQDERAIVKMEDGAMKIIKPGDVIGKSGKVIEITSGRVVIEEQTGHGMETVIIRLEEGGQKVERISRVPDRQPYLLQVQW